MTIEAMVAEGDTVAVRILSEGTNLGPLNGVAPPTGKRFTARQSHWFRVADDKLVKHRALLVKALEGRDLTLRLYRAYSTALARTMTDLLDDSDQRAALAACGREVVAGFDWPVIAQRVVEVYAAAIEATDGRVIDDEWT